MDGYGYPNPSRNPILNYKFAFVCGHSLDDSHNPAYYQFNPDKRLNAPVFYVTAYELEPV